MPRFNLLTALVIVLCVSQGVWIEVAKTEENGKAILERRQDRSEFFGKQYTYDVTFEDIAEGSLPYIHRAAIAKGRRTLTLGTAGDRKKPVPYLLTQHGENPGEPYLDDKSILMVWEASDGLHTRRFARHLFGNRKSGVFEHEALIESEVRAAFLQSDPFVSCLFAFTSELGRITGSEPLVTNFHSDLKATAESRPNCGRVYRITGKEKGFFVIVSDAPEYHFIEANFPGIQVNSIVKFGDTYYPASGSTSHAGWKSTFALKSVKDLESPPKDWFPDWPNGSAVTTLPHRTVERIPYSPGEVQAIRLHLGELDWKPPHVLEKESAALTTDK
ncbi:hypothetical protein [Stieleria sp.]|uniref:hypothetical protein n=1 Tax=Stieleria sp. TaxID=2795976 RepID=UPI0035620807